MENRRNYYRILQVQSDAPPEMIQASYRTLMRKLRHHPDLGGETWSAAVINEAYETLSDPLRRARYDRTLGLQYPRRKGPGTGPDEDTGPGQKKAEQDPAGSDSRTCRTGRRREARTEASVPVSCYADGIGKGIKARITDISPHGIGLTSRETIKEGAIIEVRSPELWATVRIINSSKPQGSDYNALCRSGAVFIHSSISKGILFRRAV